MTPEARTDADFVLSGGGVKGVGLAGAVAGLVDAGYRAQRVSGTSAGSIIGAVLAAATRRGAVTGKQLKDIALGIDYRKILDRGRAQRVPFVGSALALMRGDGIYRGDYAHQWIRGELKNLGVTKFGDLAIEDETLAEERRYALVVTVADLTRERLVRLPWDYRQIYGHDPDEHYVADAVRASMSIPFFFRPVSLRSATRLTSTLVDGGLLSNFPIDSLDRTDGRKPRWPTFGITVMPSNAAGGDRLTRALSAFGLGAPPLLERMIMTMLSGRDQAYLEQPWVSARTIQVRSSGLSVLDFDASKIEIETLYASGYAAAEEFLSRWDWQDYRDRFR
ncbi:patatin-like phospholipase family protein [Mycobacterium sp. EPa45]|uniref:patatin-like phospholipase family protein n=1 Tax=Mycobacterium sp. EPa45 TaxID=1545728 RepID=UPI000641F148|nr:patatin-like phospholipase family protein [Mycobacterium sp. EPa45]AKK26987.1 phospholipase [Mycobacterium sp. EPa45]